MGGLNQIDDISLALSCVSYRVSYQQLKSKYSAYLCWSLKLYGPLCAAVFLCLAAFLSASVTKTCAGYKLILTVVGQENRFTFQENDQVMKICSLNVQSGSIYSPRTDSGPDCFGCSN